MIWRLSLFGGLCGDGLVQEFRRKVGTIRPDDGIEFCIQNVSDLLTEAISDYLQRRCIHHIVLDHLSDSMNENDELGQLLAR